MQVSEHRWLWRGDDIRVIVAGDVVAIPGHAGSPGWSMGGFGADISQEWLLHEGGLPGPKARRLALIDMIRRSLAAHHTDTPAAGDGRERARGPWERCAACNGDGAPVPGFVPVGSGKGIAGGVLTRTAP